VATGKLTREFAVTEQSQSEVLSPPRLHVALRRNLERFGSMMALMKTVSLATTAHRREQNSKWLR
jgi:hypothetical protein